MRAHALPRLFGYLSHRCQIFGDAFDLLLAAKGMPFPQAQAYLADNGIDVHAPAKAPKAPPEPEEKPPDRPSWADDDDEF